ncbi:MAG: DUF3857 domain-containing protein [Ferruginibacter sp.]
MKKIIVTAIPVLMLFLGFSQEKLYDVSKIPEELKKNAYSVIREEQLTFDIKSIDKATYKVHKAVTILNENGRSELIFHEFTDQFRSLESASIQLFDSKGNSVQKYKRSDLLKQTAGDGLVPDGKVYYIEVPAASYPVTILVDYEIKFTGCSITRLMQFNYPSNR